MAFASSEYANPHWVRRTTLNDLSHIPGETGIPVFGTTLRTLRDPIGYSAYLQKTYGNVVRVNGFGAPGILLFGADATELALFDRDKIFSSEQGWGPVLNLLFPRGLMLMDFDHHRLDRRALGVAFKPSPMRAYVNQMNGIFAQQMPDWQGDMLFYPAIKQLTLDVAMESFFGLDLGPDADKINTAYVDMVQASIAISRRPLPFTKMKKGVEGRQYVIDFLRPQISERRRNENRQDMFSQFCRITRDDGSYMGDDEILDHMNFLILAAHDTITSSVTSLVWLLAKNPEWQEKIRAECLSIAPAGADISYDQLDQFELTEMAFKEALRLLPPVPSIPRRLLKEIEFEGHLIPKGTTVSISPAFVHLMEEHWPDPYIFDPMRFTPDLVKARHKYAWVPFGGGAHMCLGLHFAYLQMKLFIHRLLTTKWIEVADGYAPKWQAWPMPKPTDGLKVRLTTL